LLLGIAVIGFLPILYDLELGNVTVLVLAALAAIAWTPDRIATGIPLGLVLATAPKPQLIPVLIWLALVHLRALVGALVTAALASLVGLALAGPAAYATWVEILRAPAYFNGSAEGPTGSLISTLSTPTGPQHCVDTLHTQLDVPPGEWRPDQGSTNTPIMDTLS
jgi:hypothetical protein